MFFLCLIATDPGTCMTIKVVYTGTETLGTGVKGAIEQNYDYIGIVTATGSGFYTTLKSKGYIRSFILRDWNHPNSWIGAVIFLFLL